VGDDAPDAAKAIHQSLTRLPAAPLAAAAPRPADTIARLQQLLAELRTTIALPSIPPNLPDEIHLACFASRLFQLPVEARASFATPAAFRLFAEILALIPPPPLVDAICTAIDVALRRPAGIPPWMQGFAGDRVNTAYAAQVCTPSLAKALCDLVALGTEYTSPALFLALRYCMGSPEFKALSAHDPLRLFRLSITDEIGAVRRVAQELNLQHLLTPYSALSFPKPDFPLTEECMFSLSHFIAPPSFVGFFFTDPNAFDAEGTTIACHSTSLDTIVVCPTVGHVCVTFLFHSLQSHRVSGTCLLVIFLCVLLLLPSKVQLHELGGDFC
jgi:hypothetical protein